jgi:hypothetical protein
MPRTIGLILLLTACGTGSVPIETTTQTTQTTTGTTTDTTTVTTTTGTQTKPAVFGIGWSIDDTIGTLVTVSVKSNIATNGHISYSVDEGVWMDSPTQEIIAGSNNFLVLGVPYASDVDMHLVVDTLGQVTLNPITATTAPLPQNMPVPIFLSGEPDKQWADGNYIYTSINQDALNWSGDTFWKVIMDRKGRVVWAHLTEVDHWSIWVDLSNDGKYLMFDDITVYDWGSSEPSTIKAMTIDGNVVYSVEAEGLHHAWDELADGTFVWGAQITSNEEWLQHRTDDSTVETIWKCSEFEVEQLGHTASSCHSNSWWWHESTDTYLVSFPSSAGQVKDTVLHIDNQGNTLSNWGQLSDWSFEDPANTFDYQHGVTFTEDGNLLLSTQLTNANPYFQNNYDTLAVREYELDYDNKVLRQVWQFGEDEAIAGKYNGEAHRLPNGNTLHNYGTGAWLREVTPDGELVWDVRFPDGNTDGSGRLQGRSVFITDLYDFAP